MTIFRTITLLLCSALVYGSILPEPETTYVDIQSPFNSFGINGQGSCTDVNKMDFITSKFERNVQMTSTISYRFNCICLYTRSTCRGEKYCWSPWHISLSNFYDQSFHTSISSAKLKIKCPWHAPTFPSVKSASVWGEEWKLLNPETSTELDRFLVQGKFIKLATYCTSNNNVLFLGGQINSGKAIETRNKFLEWEHIKVESADEVCTSCVKIGSIKRGVYWHVSDDQRVILSDSQKSVFYLHYSNALDMLSIEVAISDKKDSAPLFISAQPTARSDVVATRAMSECSLFRGIEALSINQDMLTRFSSQITTIMKSKDKIESFLAQKNISSIDALSKQACHRTPQTTSLKLRAGEMCSYPFWINLARTHLESLTPAPAIKITTSPTPASLITPSPKPKVPERSTPNPAPRPTEQPTAAPTTKPSPRPTTAPKITERPTPSPTPRQIGRPTPAPTTKAPARPTASPKVTERPTPRPTTTQTEQPTPNPVITATKTLNPIVTPSSSTVLTPTITKKCEFCLNNGKCTFKCVCSSGFSGSYCQSSTNPMFLIPKNNRFKKYDDDDSDSCTFFCFLVNLFKALKDVLTKAIESATSAITSSVNLLTTLSSLSAVLLATLPINFIADLTTVITAISVLHANRIKHSSDTIDRIKENANRAHEKVKTIKNLKHCGFKGLPLDVQDFLNIKPDYEQILRDVRDAANVVVEAGNSFSSVPRKADKTWENRPDIGKLKALEDIIKKKTDFMTELDNRMLKMNEVIDKITVNFQKCKSMTDTPSTSTPVPSTASFLFLQNNLRKEFCLQYSQSKAKIGDCKKEHMWEFKKWDEIFQHEPEVKKNPILKKIPQCLGVSGRYMLDPNGRRYFPIQLTRDNLVGNCLRYNSGKGILSANINVISVCLGWLTDSGHSWDVVMRENTDKCLLLGLRKT